MGYMILAVSPDRPEKIKQEVGKTKLTYSIYSDSKLNAAKAFGLAYQLDEKTLEIYKRYNIDLNEASGEAHNQLPVPAVFIIGKDGVIDFQYVNPDYRVRLDPKVILAAARAGLK